MDRTDAMIVPFIVLDDNINVGIYITIMTLIMTVVSDHINIIRRQ